MSDKIFNIIRFLAEIGISAVGALYWALSGTWGWPYGEQIVATCAAVSTFLGIFTEWQRWQYAKEVPEQNTFNEEETEEEGE